MTDIDASERLGSEDQPPRVFISYSDDSVAHAKRVLELAQWLRSHGVDATIDQFEESPEEGWPQWVYRQIRESEFVLIIATPAYLRRCEGDEPRTDTTGSITKFGSHLTLQELHEAGGRNRKFVPVLFGGDAVVQSVPLPLRGATCYRLPDQRDELYRRLTGQPKVQRAPLGVLKTFDDESLLDSVEDGALYLPDPIAPLARGRASLDEQLADDSLRAVVDAGIVDDPELELLARRRQRRRRSKRQWLITISAFGVAFMSVGLFIGRRVLVPNTDSICRIQLTDANNDVIDGIDSVELRLPSGHAIEVVVEDGRTLRFACPEDRVQVQAHVFLEGERAQIETQADPSLPATVALRMDGRVALPASGEVGEEVAQAEFVEARPARPVKAPGSEPEPEPAPEPSPAGIDIKAVPGKPATRPPDELDKLDVATSLAEARKASLAGNDKQAYALAKVAYEHKQSDEALQIMGVAACKFRSESNAREAYDKLTDSNQKRLLAKTCAALGVELGKSTSQSGIGAD